MIRPNVSHMKLVAGLSPALIAGAASAAVWVPTNYGIGADAEVRESSPTTNRGSSTELASRTLNNFIAGNAGDGNDRNSAIYTKFDLTGAAIPANLTTAFRLTYRNNNLNASRISDTVTPNSDVRTGIAVYGLTNHALSGWDESTITYLNAPGITFDGDVGTKDFNSDLTFLGTVLFPEIGSQNRLPVGESLIFTSVNLDNFVANALANGDTSVTLVTTMIHDGETPLSNWTNFNYLFNPKEQTTLNSDPNYDADVNDPNNPLGSPFGGAANPAEMGPFSPALLLAPEPSSLGLIALGGVLAMRRRR